MSYALINLDGTLNSTTTADSLFWRNLHITGLSRLTPAERRNLGIYDHAQKFQEPPVGKKQQGFTQEINHAEGVVYEVPIFVDKTEAELAREKNEKIKAEIAQLEAATTPRRYREAVLSDDGKAWLVSQDVKIVELRKNLVVVPEIPEE